eukprot:gb/GEZJ01009989.1/.p1 GENE.gb/GEZJ01009989.1/~~gb/GEZJ01009989.1/.p1  ORF type:complete len:126 (+),score=2.08 gb/GEZJ01009989.1/:413-790(+)
MDGKLLLRSTLRRATDDWGLFTFSSSAGLKWGRLASPNLSQQSNSSLPGAASDRHTMTSSFTMKVPRCTNKSGFTTIFNGLMFVSETLGTVSKRIRNLNGGGNSDTTMKLRPGPLFRTVKKPNIN